VLCFSLDALLGLVDLLVNLEDLCHNQLLDPRGLVYLELAEPFDLPVVLLDLLGDLLAGLVHLFLLRLAPVEVV
jgi:hypothetical protein